ncbi:hypothetical protein NQZ68_007460 [Dissostichus eleginoides]|nr:hypothetical protein NQZ68_007460 [Dissostichus eleginoides]
MEHLLLLLLLSAGLQAEGTLNQTAALNESVRLVGGSSRCEGDLEVKYQGEWRPVDDYYRYWNLKAAEFACRELDCGSAVSVGQRESSWRPVWGISRDCLQYVSALRECAGSSSSDYLLDLTCSDSVRLLGGTGLCSGRLEVNSDQSNQSNPSWSSVCEADFDQQDAQVVCRQLGCGAPSVLQGALYGEGEAPMWTKEFQCGGHESALLDCNSASERNTCSPGTAVSLTCSESVRLVGGSSRCEGDLEVKYRGEWRPVGDLNEDWNLKEAAVACRDLNCGSAVSVEREESSERPAWVISPECLDSGSALRECAEPAGPKRSTTRVNPHSRGPRAASASSHDILNLTCSDMLLQPNISVSSSMYGVSGAQQQGFQVFRGSTFSISCSIQPQYPGGSFQLSSSTHNYTQPAVNHSAHFLFPAAEPAHQGNYSCVYHLLVRSHRFSSESRLLSVTVSDPTPLILRAVVLLLIQLLILLLASGLYFCCKATRGQRRQEDMELQEVNLAVMSLQATRGQRRQEHMELPGPKQLFPID